MIKFYCFPIRSTVLGVMLSGVLLMCSAIAQADTDTTTSPPASTYGPGMMMGGNPGRGGYGPGPMANQGAGCDGYGPGMMYGYGPRMMGSGMMSPEMMGGYGPGMMGSGYMRGSGMMYGQGFGPGMRMGYGRGFGFAGLHLTHQQRQRLYDIQVKSMQKYWTLFGRMQKEHFEIARLLSSTNPDQKTVDEAYNRLSQTGKAMLDLRLENHRAALQLLTPEQRKLLDQRAP